MGAAGFERCPRTVETDFIFLSQEVLENRSPRFFVHAVHMNIKFSLKNVLG